MARSFSQRCFDGFESFGDVTFSVGEPGHEKEIKASLFILRVSSPVFETMFNSTWNEQRQVVKIPDIRPEMFRNFLKLLVESHLNEGHIRALNLTIQEILCELLYIAKKYQVTFIHSACIKFLKSETTQSPSAALIVYEYARICNEGEVEDTTFTFIAKNIAAVIKTNEFLELSRDSLTRLLNSSGLVIKEVILFLHLVRWAEEECDRRGLTCAGGNLRQVMGDLLLLIRFPLLLPLEIVKFVRPTKVLSDKEIVDLIEYIVRPPNERARNFPYGDSPRSWVDPALNHGQGSGQPTANRPSVITPLLIHLDEDWFA